MEEWGGHSTRGGSYRAKVALDVLECRLKDLDSQLTRVLQQKRVTNGGKAVREASGDEIDSNRHGGRKQCKLCLSASSAVTSVERAEVSDQVSRALKRGKIRKQEREEKTAKRDSSGSRVAGLNRSEVRSSGANLSKVDLLGLREEAAECDAGRSVTRRPSRPVSALTGKASRSSVVRSRA